MRAVGAAKFWMDDIAPVEALRLRRTPLLAAALFFACGEMLAKQWQFAAVMLIAVTLLLLLSLVAVRKAPGVAAVPILALWAVAGCWCGQMQPSADPQKQLLQYADGLNRTVRGRVVRMRTLPPTAPSAHSMGEAAPLDPAAPESESSTATESVDLEVEQVEWMTPDVDVMRSVRGGVRLTIMGGVAPLACGDVLEVPLRLRQPERYRDAGAWSYADELLSQGISVQASVKAARLQKVSGAARSLRCRAYAAQSWASARLSAFATSHANMTLPQAARLTANDTAMLDAMLFGDRAGLRHDLRVGFERTGSFHLFVVSGMHVALLAGMLFWALRRLRASHGFATLITLAITASYALLTGFGVPVQRALLMTSVFLVARWIGRNVSVLQALGAAALTVLVVDPRSLAEASFQMTFLVLVAVGGLAMPLSERMLLPRLRAARDLDAVWLDARLPPKLAQMRVMLRLFGNALAACGPAPFAAWLRLVPALGVRAMLRTAELVLVSVVIEACMALPMAVYFHRATPFALPANLLAIPLVGLLAPLAVVTFCASLVSTWLAALPAGATALVLHGVSWAIAHLSRMRFADTRVPAPAMGVIALVVVCLAGACWAVRRRSRWLVAAGVVAIAVVPLATLWPEPPLLHSGVLEVTALDVGQGDSLLVASPDGHTLLVDAGGPVGQAANTDRWDVGEEVVAPYLWSRRLRRLDVVLLTHAHSDHMGGMPAILRDFHPRELWVSIDPAESDDYKSLLAEAARLDITLRHFHAGEHFDWGGMQASVLAPEIGYSNSKAPINDDSLVMRFEFGKSSALLEGDAERRSEDIMLANGRIAPVTLLKVGHHGSKTSTNPEFLAVALPQAAVISDGRRNTFGHPRYEVLQRLEEAHVKTIRIDRRGATTFLLRPDGSLLTVSAAE